MKQKKITLHILLSLVVVFVMFLSACSSNNGGGSSSATTSGAQNGEPELAPYEVKLTYFGTPQADDALVEEELSKYFKEKINATIKLEPISNSDYQQRTELAMNTGEKMDLVFSASWLAFFSNITKGAYLELDELLEKHGQGIKERLNPLYLEAPRLEGKLYAIPTNKEITQGTAYTYREDIVEKYDVPIEEINKLEDFEPWLQIIKENEPEIIPYFVGGGRVPALLYNESPYRMVEPQPAAVPMFFINTLQTDSDELEVHVISDPEIVAIDKAGYAVYRDFYEKGYINADSATTKVNVGDYRKQGKLWVQNVVWKPGYDEIQEAGDNFMYEYISHVVEEPVVTTSLATGSMMSISRTSNDPERAMMVLNALHTDPYVVNLIVNGIEGKHYKKVGDNRIEQIPDSGYGKTALNWVIGNQLLNYLRPGEPDTLYQDWEKFNNEAKRFPLLGFVFNDSNVKSEITNLTAVANEYDMISSGAFDNPGELVDERNQRLLDAGLLKVKEELQKQINEWWALNKK